jgi:hypothetical protein|tara:strand:+ start:170 stop:439 length:270 start_codon:yes stop_codon:yes gene_type:complete
MTQLFPGEDEKYTDENGAEYKVDRDTHDHDMTYENESTRDTTPMVRISLKEYNDLRDQTKYITDPTLIGAIDKIEFFVKELRKHIVRKY